MARALLWVSLDGAITSYRMLRHCFGGLCGVGLSLTLVLPSLTEHGVEKEGQAAWEV